MRQFIIASHAHFAAGINESVSLLSGERDNVRTLSMYVEGNNDLAAAEPMMLESVMRHWQATALLACAFCLPRSRGEGQSWTVDRE